MNAVLVLNIFFSIVRILLKAEANGCLCSRKITSHSYEWVCFLPKHNTDWFGVQKPIRIIHCKKVCSLNLFLQKTCNPRGYFNWFNLRDALWQFSNTHVQCYVKYLNNVLRKTEMANSLISVKMRKYIT